MDKIGPMCRSVEDCALVFNAIYGPDGRDDTVVDAPFSWKPDVPLSKLRIGYLKAEFEGRQPEPPSGRGAAPGASGQGGRGRGATGPSPEEQRKRREAQLKVLSEALDVYRTAGATLHPIEPLPGAALAGMLSFILSVEAAAAFDDLTRSEDIKDTSLGSWPNTFRTSRFVPAVGVRRVPVSHHQREPGADQPDGTSGRRVACGLLRQRAGGIDGHRAAVRRGHDAARRTRVRARDEVASRDAQADRGELIRS
jgi:hypothetical protein